MGLIRAKGKWAVPEIEAVTQILIRTILETFLHSPMANKRLYRGTQMLQQATIQATQLNLPKCCSVWLNRR